MRQRTEVVDDASWVMGFLDIIDPAIDRIKKLLNLERNSYNKEPSRYNPGANEDKIDEESGGPSPGSYLGNDLEGLSGFDLDEFVKDRLSLDPYKLDVLVETAKSSAPRRIKPSRKIYRSANKITA